MKGILVGLIDGAYGNGSTNLVDSNVLSLGDGEGTSSPSSIAWSDITGGTINVDGSIRYTNSNGYIDLGPKNAQFSHVYTDRPAFYFNKAIEINGDNVATEAWVIAQGYGAGTSDGNNYANSLTFSTTTGVLTLGRLGLTSLTRGLDGRYAILSAANTFTGNITAPAFYESSLRKYKENIKDFNLSGLTLVNSLDIKTFDRKEGVKNKIGIIADDSSKEFLSEDKDAVDLYKTVFIQAKAIQELNSKLDSLEKRLKQLENGKAR